MLPITVTVERPRRWWLLERARRVWRRALPERWEEVPRLQRLTYFSRLLTDDPGAVQYVLRDILNLPRWAWHCIGVEDMAAMLMAIDWMKPRNDCSNPVLQSFYWKGECYHLPKADFANGCCLEFVVADDHYKAFLESSDLHKVMLIVATLCREENPDAKEVLASGDPRVPFHDSDEAEARARRLEGLNPTIVAAVLQYFTGVKVMVAETYAVLFEEPKEVENEEETPAQEGSDGPLFGWWSTFMAVGQKGLFGDYYAVLQRRLHLICMHLLDEHVRSEQQRRQIEAERFKHNSNSDDL